MTVGTEVVTGVSEVSEAKSGMDSYQDLPNVGADCNGTKLEVVDGNGSVCDDPNGTSTADSDSCEVTADDLKHDSNGYTVSKPVPNFEVCNTGDVQYGKVADEKGGGILSLSVYQNICVLSSTEKDVSLLDKPNGDDVDLASINTMKQENGTVVEERGNGHLDSDMKVEDQAELALIPEQKENQDSQIDVNEELEEGHGSVITSIEVGCSSYQNGKFVEKNDIDSTVELEGQKSTIMLEDGNSSDKSSSSVDHGNAELGVWGTSSLKASDLSDKSIKSAERDDVDLTAEMEGNKTFQNAAGEYVLPQSEVIVPEDKYQEQPESEPVDPVTHQVDVEEEKIEKMTGLNGIKDVDGVEKLANKTEAANSNTVAARCESQEIEVQVQEDKSQELMGSGVDSVSRQLNVEEEEKVEKTTDTNVPTHVDGVAKTTNKTEAVNVVFVAVGCELSEFEVVVQEDKLQEGLESGSVNSFSDQLDNEEGNVEKASDLNLYIHKDGAVKLANETEAANIVTETSLFRDGESSYNNSDGNKGSQTEENSEHTDGCQNPAELTRSVKNSESLPSVSAEIGTGEVPSQNCISFLASPDGGILPDQGLLAADYTRSGVSQGHESKTPEQDMKTGAANGNVNPENAGSSPLYITITKDETRELPVEDENLNSGSEKDIIREREACTVASPVTENSSMRVSDDTKAEIEDKSCDTEDTQRVIFAADCIKLDARVDNGPTCALSTLSGIEFGSFRPSELVSVFRCDTVLMKTQDSNVVKKCEQTRDISNHLNPKNIVKSDVQNSSCISISNMPLKDASIARSEVICCQENAQTLGSPRNDISAPLDEGSNSNAVNTRDLCDEAELKPFQFLIRLPRFDDQLKEQIRYAQLLVDEKTAQRDNIRVKFLKENNNLRTHRVEYDAARAEEVSTRRSLKLKRQEIDYVQNMISRVKNALSVEDIDNRINHMNNRMQHETLPLKEEMLLIREMKQMKQRHSELSSNIGSLDEVQQALDQRNNLEERLKILKKELDGLKEKVSKDEAVARLLEKKYDDEQNKLKELDAQFIAANNIRQEAYRHFSDLKRKLKEKNKYFWAYKDDAKAASEYAFSGNREALNHLCVKQVESVMGLWNKNDEFRKEYVRCNMRSTLRRFKTLDGRSLGPDEEAPVLPNYVDERMDTHLSGLLKGIPQFPHSTVKQEKLVPSVKEGAADVKSMQVKDPKNQILESKTIAKPIPGSSLESVSGKVETDEMKVEENLQTKEELELARKAEALRKEEMDAKLEEQRRVEEKAKAQEALERKKRNAEKAQIRAKIRAQKEAEQKEKEKEKRLRKKEKKKSLAANTQDSNIDVETSSARNLPAETTKQSESKENSTTATRPQKTRVTKQSKPKTIPPLRNRGKRRFKQALLWIAGILVVLLIIFGGDGGAFGSRK